MEFRIFNKASGAAGKGPQDLTALAVRMKKGDRRAAAVLCDELLPKAYGFFFSRTSERETAEDLSQEIFLKLVEKVDSFDESRGHFIVWFWRMARNMLVDHYRAKREKPFSEFEEEAVEAMAVHEMPDIDDRLQHRKVLRFVAALEKDDRDLFEMRYIAEMPYGEIAALLERSEGALRVAAMRLKEKIKREFGNADDALLS